MEASAWGGGRLHPHMQVKQILSSGSEELPFEVTSQKVAGHLFSSVPVGCVLCAFLPEVDLPELQGSSAKETAVAEESLP